MDWVAQLQTGRASVKVHFTGGAITAYGVTPAEYTTDNDFIQKVIENSAPFKDGRIQIGKSVEIGEVRNTVNANRNRAVDNPLRTDPQNELPAQVNNKAPETNPEATPDDSMVQQDVEGESSPEEVEVTCLQDAQDYLQQHFGLSSHKVRSIAAAQKAAMEHGVMFVGGSFGN